MSWKNLTIGLIPDGNRRWATKYQKSPKEAYCAAAQRTAEVVMTLRNKGVKQIYIYGASAGNIAHRDPSILKFLIDAFIETFSTHNDAASGTGVKLSIIGDTSPIQLSGLEQFDRLKELDDVEATTNCIIAFNHSLSWEIKVAASHCRDAREFTGDELIQALPTINLPQLDMVIRTAGEKRLSGFFPLQTIYAELFFVDTLWPDFNVFQLEAIMSEYITRKRTFGR